VIENEYGEVSVDDAIVQRKAFGEEDIIEMNNGCICCTVRGDLIRILTSLLQRKGGKFDAILIETTGLADPAPVAQTFFVHDELQVCACVRGFRRRIPGFVRRANTPVCPFGRCGH
jgi:G3E family GTPase